MEYVAFPVSIERAFKPGYTDQLPNKIRKFVGKEGPSYAEAVARIGVH